MENLQKTQAEIKRKQHAVRLMMLNFGFESAVYIGAPLVGFIYLGKWLESRYHTKVFLLVGIFLAFGLSSYLIYRRLKDIKNLLK